MDKRGQLGWIEFKFWFAGFIVGFIGSLVLVLLGSKEVLPFKIPFVCGSVLSPALLNKKGQLGPIEFKFFMFGFGVGIVLGFLLVGLGTGGVLPFKIPLVCG